jgi:hypothetical protein
MYKNIEKCMSAEEKLQAIVDKTIENAIVNLDNYQNEVNASNDVLKVKEIKEYLFGLIMGQVLLGGISALAQMKGGKEMPTPQEQTKVRDMVYKRVPQIRKRIFDI